MNILNRLLINLYKFPFLFLMIAFFITILFIVGKPSNPILLSSYELLQTIIPWIVIGLLSISLVWFAYSSYRYYLWKNNRTKNNCYNCGCITDYIPNGRYGPYYKCLGCGSNRSDK